MKKNVIVVGGGFGGLQFIQNLDRDLFDVLLIDKLNHHMFQPLFYQVATSQLEPSSISFPFRKVLENYKNVRIRMAEVLAVNPAENSIQTSIGSFNYDYLVIATGCKTNYFDNEILMNNVKSLKTTYQAITIRNSILENFEKILYVDEAEKESLFNIVIVGGGPTGVELAGAFAEIKRDVLPRDYPRIDFSRLKIILLEGGQNTLPSMSGMAQKASKKYLINMGVDLRTGIFVKHYDGETITLGNGETIKSKNVIWAAGLTGNLLDGLDKNLIVKGNRIKVDRINQVNGYGNIFAIGDIAYMETPFYPKGHPQVANVAINQGKRLAKNLKAIILNKKPKPYEYKDLGSMATIGRNKAVVDLPFVRFKGYVAWLVWMFLHLMLILSVRNKLIIFINWTINYVTKSSSLRLILKNV